MTDIFVFLKNFTEFLQKIAINIWGLIATPVVPYLQELQMEGQEWVKDWFITLADFIFHAEGSLLSILPGLIIIIIIMTIIKKFSIL